MGRRSKGVLSELVEMPWWASVVASALVYACLRWLTPAMAGDTGAGSIISKIAVPLAPYAAFLFLLPAPFAALRHWRQGQLLARATDSAALRSIPWDDFETLVAAAYRRLGYDVKARGGRGADGGVDLVRRERGKTTLVQCKHWNRQQVGVAIVRELYGVMNAELAEAGVIVTGGTFTADAEAFARGKSIELVNGAKLEQFLSYARGDTSAAAEKPSAPAEPPLCPKCAEKMVLRTAKRGAQAGAQFWGCPRWPACKGTRELERR